MPPKGKAQLRAGPNYRPPPSAKPNPKLLPARTGEIHAVVVDGRAALDGDLDAAAHTRPHENLHRARLYRWTVLREDRAPRRPRVKPLSQNARKLDLRKTIFLLPNVITLSSVFCGFDSIRISATAQADDDYYRASLLLVFALFFDTLDGRVARLTKTQSAFGLQIDSLSDAICFGVAPAILVFKWSLWQRPLLGLLSSYLFAAAGAVRLARFNVLSMGDKGAPTKPGKYIVGLPVPGAAGILISLVLANHTMGDGLRLYGPKYVWAMMALTIFLSVLMVSTIKFRSFKDVRLNARTFALVAFAVGSSAIVSLQTRPAFVLVWLLTCYVVIGLVESALALSNRARRHARRSLPPV
jgi:CDP-diacylglycerol--serine O-phosphatidyltransferase